MSTLKEKYQQFRRWQEKPFEYHDSEARHTCCNCGNEYTSNYCPRCGQRAILGPINWQNVWQGIMDMWGIGSRSLPYSLWQLLWRPGYLIRDYISGKRQVSFPPVKMLVIMGVIALLVDQLYPEIGTSAEPVAPTGLMHYYDVISNWFVAHLEWGVLVSFSFIIIPVWILFREAPGYSRHSLPQGFFIQVFTATQFLLVACLILEPLSLFIPKFNNYAPGILLLLVVPCMLMIDYKQLFGYGWWGTLWRVAMAIPFGTLFYRILLRLIEAIDCWINNGRLVPEFWGNLMIIVDLVIMIWLMAEIVGVINRKSWREQGWWQTLKRPLLIAALSLATGFACYLLGENGAVAGLVSSYMSMIS